MKEKEQYKKRKSNTRKEKEQYTKKERKIVTHAWEESVVRKEDPTSLQVECTMYARGGVCRRARMRNLLWQKKTTRALAAHIAFQHSVFH